MKKTYIILDNIRSMHNVGSIFRTADGAGVAKIFLVGTTPCPVDRFGRGVSEIAKTSLGATEFVDWEYAEDAVSCVQTLQRDGVSVVAVEQDARSISYIDRVNKTDVAYVFGNEIDGVSPQVLDSADAIIEIPMRGQKESLNVSVTAGIILFNR